MKRIELICPRKLDRLKLEFSATLFWLGEEQNRMKASNFSDAQKAFIISQGEELRQANEILRKASAYFAMVRKAARHRFERCL